MTVELQKAKLWKRITAWIFDTILLVGLAAGMIFLLSDVFGYDAQNEALVGAYARYEEEYGVSFQMSQEELTAMTQEEQDRYQEAYDALMADEEAMYAYSMIVSLTFLLATFGILLAFGILEFVIPLMFGNGQTLGKKMMSLGVIRRDAVQLNGLKLFIRSILGKFTLEMMVPVYLILMVFWGIIGSFGITLFSIILVALAACFCFTPTHFMVHDLMAGTVVVDIDIQEVFRTPQDLRAYQNSLSSGR